MSVYVGVDVHRKRSQIAVVDEAGEVQLNRNVANGVEPILNVIGGLEAGTSVAFEAAYGWGWLVELLEDYGFDPHLVHPTRCKAIAAARLKNDKVDAAILAQLLRADLLPEAWIAPPATRELRELVRHRAKLVALRSNLKCQVYAVLAACGVPVVMSDLFGAGGQALLTRVVLPPAFRARVNSARRLIEALDFEIELFTNLVGSRLRGHGGYTAIQTISGVGPILAAVFVAEIGDVHRFGRAAQLASWAGLTPQHHESDTTVHRGRITKQGCRLVRWAAVEAVQRTDKHSRLGRVRDQVAQRRGRNIGTVAAARELIELVFYGLRDGHIRCLNRRSA
jgi:transposase